MTTKKKLGEGGDPGMIWQSYRSAQNRKEHKVARERLSTYLRLWWEAGETIVTPSPMISSSSDRYGLIKPPPAFIIPGEVWLLNHRPNGLITALEGYIEFLSKHITSNEILGQLNKEGVQTALVFKDIEILSWVLAMIAGCSENYNQISKSHDLFGSAVGMVLNLLKLIKTPMLNGYFKFVLSSLERLVAFIHCMVDPRRHWQQSFMRLHTLSDPSISSSTRAPGSVVNFFIQVFNEKWDISEDWKEVWSDLQLSVLHMMGALLYSSKDNACLATCQDTCLLLLTFLDPREKCTPLQALTVKVYVSMVHVLHNTLPVELQVTVDCGVMLVGFLNILSPRYHEKGLVNPCIKMVITMLDVIPKLVNPPGNTQAFKELFVEVGCFEKICEVLTLVRDEAKENPEISTLVCRVFYAFSSVMERCPTVRLGFEQRVGHYKLSQLISSITKPTEAILQQALNMAVEGSYKYKEDAHQIHNTPAVAMLLHWLLTLPMDLQTWLAKRLYDLCSNGALNKQRCCTAGILKVLVEVLVASQQEGKSFCGLVEDRLIALIEVLGSHSIRAAELKQLIGVLRPLEGNQLPSYYYRIQKALTVMTHRIGKEGVTPLYYFNFRMKGTCICIPELQHFPTSTSFTFSTWVSLDYTRGRDSDEFLLGHTLSKTRRVLYSFYTSSGTGFEAFFTNQLVLVVATVTKKEFISLNLKEFPLSPINWHNICIAYHVSKKPWGKSEVYIYIDGDLKRVAVMKAPNFSDSFTSACIGFAPSRGTPPVQRQKSPCQSHRSDSLSSLNSDLEVSATPTVNSTLVGEAIHEWGRVINLCGLISSLCIFSDTLSANSVKTLYKRGPNDLSLFQPKCPETHDLANRLYVYYHAKAVQNGVCFDLSPLHVAYNRLDGRFNGQHYVTWDVQAVLGSLGGVELLFPLLEQVHLPLKKTACTPSVVEPQGKSEDVPNALLRPLTLRSPSPLMMGSSWFDENEGVASFLKLLLSMLDGSAINQQVFFLSESPATIGALLQKIPASGLTVPALSTIQELVEHFSQIPEHRCDMYKHLLFDFRIWSRPEFAVRIGHTQYISTIVKENIPECRQNFGVQFMLDVIRVFYSSMGSTVPNANLETIQLNEEEQQSIRAAILMNVKLYVMNDIHWDEVDAIMSFLTAATDSNLQEEILRLLLKLLTNAPCHFTVGEQMWEKGLPLLVLIRAQSMSVRLLAIKIISHLCGQHSYNESGPIYAAFKNGSLAAALGHMAEHKMSSSVVLALYELCVAKNTRDYSDYISNLDIYLSVLQLLRKAPLMVRHTICQQVISMLYHTPEHVTDIAQSFGWENLFLWLLTPYIPEGRPANDSSSDSGELSEKEDSPIKEEEEEEDNKVNHHSVIVPSTYVRISSSLENDIRTSSQEEGDENTINLTQIREDHTIMNGVSDDVFVPSDNGSINSSKEDIMSSNSDHPAEEIGQRSSHPQKPTSIYIPSTDKLASSHNSVKADSAKVIVNGESTVAGGDRLQISKIAHDRTSSMVQCGYSHNPAENNDRNYRGRSPAFLDPKTTGDRAISMSGNSVVDATKFRTKNSMVKSRDSITYATTWCEHPEEEDEEVMRTYTAVTEAIGYVLWRSVDYDSKRPPWKVWGKFFASLDTFASEHTLIVPACTVKQRIFVLLMNAVTLDIKEQGINRDSLLDVILQLSEMLETFVITNYSNLSSSREGQEDHDVMLLKLAHNFFPDLDSRHCTIELLEKYLNMLTSAQIFESTSSHGNEELQICQSAIRLLLACVSKEDKDYYVAASLKLQHLSKSPSLPKPEIHFILSNLARILNKAIQNDESERPHYISDVIRSLFTQHIGQLDVTQLLPDLPDLRAPTFSGEFVSYCTESEWRGYQTGTLKTAEAHYNSVLIPWLYKLSSHVQECHEIANRNEEQRRQQIVSHEDKYQLEVSQKFYELYEQEVRRQKSVDSQQRNELSVALQKWRGSRRFFTGERGAWSARKPEPYLWKLDRTENFSRMRLRLNRNYNCNQHTDASQLRDTGTIVSVEPEPIPADATCLLSKVTAKRDSIVSFFEEEDVLLEQLWSDANSPGVRDNVHEQPKSLEKEKTLRSFPCDLITLTERSSGSLEITTQHLYFYTEQQDKKENQAWYSTDFKIPLSQVMDIYSRRYNMSRTALEIFIVDQTNYFLNFSSQKTVSKVCRDIYSLRPPNLNRLGIHKPIRLLNQSSLTSKWVRREITTFDYLIQLNTIAGRTYNDLNQYPVFPWVLRDYTSAKLDLSDPKVFRDLSKPVGIQNPIVEESVKLRYEEFDDPTMGKFHFGSHYSNAAGVMHFLVRLEPFTTLHIELQSGKFDYADRQFFSIASTWKTIYKTGSDVKELIPEFFYLPEFLKNSNGFDLGALQTGQKLHDVILPPWAESPEEFIIKHREALESDYVSANLHNWIDLIFGYKQIGPEAEKACNIFNFYTYEQNVDLESIKNEKEKRQIESIINNFGQTPTQLFTEPHPQRLTVEAARRHQAKGFTASFIGRRSLISLFDNLIRLKAHSVEISENVPVVFAGTPSIQTRALLVSGNPEPLVTITEQGLLNTHNWLPFSNSKNRPFTFQLDANTHFDRSKWQYVGGPFAPDLTINSNLFILSPNNKLLVTGGHWDNSFRVYSIDRGKLNARVAHHNDIVTCMALDKAGSGDHMITGSRDTTCAIWKFGGNTLDHPLQTLYGHDSEVLCVDISTELDLAVSGAKDGTCLIHTVRHGRYLNTIQPRKGTKCEIHHVAISGHGVLIIYSEDRAMRQRAIAAAPPSVHLYTINGQFLRKKDLTECLNSLLIVDKYLITGNCRGFLTFRDLFSLRQISSLNLLEPIGCLSIVLDHHTKVATHLLAGLNDGKLIIVSVKEDLNGK